MPCLPSSLSRSLLLLILAASFAAPLPASAQDTTTVAAGYAVRGTIVNAVSGQPVARALVSLNEDNAMLTGSQGEFSFDNLPAGEYFVSVQKPGYTGFGGMLPGMGNIVVRYSRGGRHMQTVPPHRIQVGPDMPALTFAITPLAMIAGHITLSTADPADGIQVQVYGRYSQNGRTRWSFAGQARTRSDGSFRISDLEPGTYIVTTQASLDRPPAGNNDQAPVWGYPALYYPGVTEISGAGMLSLTAGQQAEADLTLTRQQFFPVIAVVHSPADTPANFEVLDSAGRPTGLPASWDRREGLVHANVPSGTWTMEAHAYGRSMQWGSTSFQVNGAPASFAISIIPVPRIPVVIRREFLASADGSQQPDTSGPGMNLVLAPADDIDLGRGGGAGLNHEDSINNEWQLNVTEPGRYWVEAQAYPPAYISSITSGGVDLGSNPLNIIPGSTPPPIEVTLHNDAGTITGQINSQNPNASAPGSASPSGERPQVWIYAIPLFSTPAQLPEGSMDSSSQFTIPMLAPGSYRVVACDSQQDIDFHSPEGLAAWAGKGQTVTVDPGGTASVELDILHVTAAAP
ncbi:MAG: carboxypeptidase-like regulatory domain-containing protein [Acidobacteriaceae bacterium]